MKKNFIKIIILCTLFTTGALIKAAAPIVPSTTLSVTTGQLSSVNITDTTAFLLGAATPDSKLPTTAYFRYSTASTPPVFCNDIYGVNMISTLDIKITYANQTFQQLITGLTPDTNYYYCGIVSTKNEIKYGSVQYFRTTTKTAINTNNAESITTNSVKLKGDYVTKQSKITTSFEYRKNTNNEIWIEVNKGNHNADKYGINSGTLEYSLTGLTTNTSYQYRAKGETGNGTTANPNQTTYGNTLNFKTNPNSNCGNNGVCVVTTPTFCETHPTDPTCVINTGGGTTGNSGNNGSGSTGTGGNGTTNTGPLVLGANATPPGDAVVHYHEGIETVFARQIVANRDLALKYGYNEGSDIQSFAYTLAHFFAMTFGYISQNGREIRVSQPDIAAYQLQLDGNVLTVYEYFEGRIINIQKITDVLREKYGYEYYFR